MIVLPCCSDRVSQGRIFVEKIVSPICTKLWSKQHGLWPVKNTGNGDRSWVTLRPHSKRAVFSTQRSSMVKRGGCSLPGNP